MSASLSLAPAETRGNLRFIDWIWNIRGSVPLAPNQSGEEAFERLDPLFRESGTSHDRTSDMLTFRKKDQAAQDKMSIFDGGTLQIDRDAGGPVLRYSLTSRALLFCFLAPLLFLAFAQLNVAIGKWENTPAKTAEKKDEKKPEKKDVVQPQNAIDKFLGAPAPEKPDAKKKEAAAQEDKGPSPTPAYVFAGLFAALYLVGRILEDRLIKSLFRRRLAGA